MKKLLCILVGILSFNFSNAQQLEKLIKEGLENNSKIQLFDLKYQVAKEKVNEASTLPNTQIGVGVFVSEPETRTGAQRFKLSAKQMLPSFGSITARKNYKNAIADAVYVDIAIEKRKLVASISQSYYTLYALKNKQQILSENISLLEKYETILLKYVEVGKASAVNVLRLHMRKNDLTALKQVLQQEFLAEQTLLNKILNRDKNIPISIGELLMISESDLINKENLDLHPELLKYDKLYQSIEKSELVNKKEQNPMFGFGLDYIAVSERPNMSFTDNGKDILMPMATISIPLFNKTHKSKTKQNELRQQEIITQKQDKKNRLITLLDKAFKKRNSAIINYNAQVKNLEQATNAETILFKNFETGSVNFNDILEIQELQLKFQINKIEAIKTYYLQTTIINYLTN